MSKINIEAVEYDKIIVLMSASKKTEELTAQFYSIATLSPVPIETKLSFIKKDDVENPQYNGKSYQLVDNSNSYNEYSINQSIKGQLQYIWVWWEDSLQANGTISDDDVGGPKPTERGTLVSIQSQS